MRPPKAVINLNSAKCVLKQTHLTKMCDSDRNRSIQKPDTQKNIRVMAETDTGHDEFWAALQTNYNYIMDTNLIDSCKEASVEIEHNVIKDVKGSKPYQQLGYRSSNLPATLSDPRSLRRWLRDVEDRLEATPTLSEAMQMKSGELQKRLNDHSELYREIMSQTRFVGACIRASEDAVKSLDKSSVVSVKGLEHRYHLLYLKAMESQCLLEGLLVKQNSPKFTKASSETDEEPVTKLARFNECHVNYSNYEGAKEESVENNDEGQLDDYPGVNDCRIVPSVTSSNATGSSCSLLSPMSMSNINLDTEEDINELEISATTTTCSDTLNYSSKLVDTILKRPKNVDSSKFNRSNRKSKNCAIFYFKHSDTDGDQKELTSEGSASFDSQEVLSSEDEWFYNEYPGKQQSAQFKDEDKNENLSDKNTNNIFNSNNIDEEEVSKNIYPNQTNMESNELKNFKKVSKDSIEKLICEDVVYQTPKMNKQRVHDWLEEHPIKSNISVTQLSTYSDGKILLKNRRRLHRRIKQRKSESDSSESHVQPKSVNKVLEKSIPLPTQSQSTEDLSKSLSLMSIKQRNAYSEMQINEINEKMTKPSIYQEASNLGSLAKLANYNYEESEEELGQTCSLSEQSWDNFQEEYQSDTHSERFVSDAVRNLMEFGEDYRNFLDSQSDCCSSLMSIPNNEISPVKLIEILPTLESESPPKTSAENSRVCSPDAAKLIEAELKHKKRLDRKHKKSVERRINKMNDLKILQDFSRSGASHIKTDTYTESVNRKLDFVISPEKTPKTPLISDTITVRHTSTQLNNIPKMKTVSTEVSDSESEIKLKKKLDKKKNHSKYTEALNIPFHLLKPEDFSEIISICRGNIRCLEAILLGPPGVIPSSNGCLSHKTPNENEKQPSESQEIEIKEESTVVYIECRCARITRFIARVFDFLLNCTNIIKNWRLYRYFVATIRGFYKLCGYVNRGIKYPFLM